MRATEHVDRDVLTIERPEDETVFHDPIVSACALPHIRICRDALARA
jgi:hypothetical protein